MQPLINIDDYFELMDHEFNDVAIRPTKDGYRIDRNGIKNRCNYANLKSVDYLHESNNQLTLIEFSDLAKQHLAILDKIAAFKACNLDKREITRNVKRLHREIGSEIKNKYMDTLCILRKIPNVFHNVPAWMIADSGRLIIVVAPTQDDIEESKKEDIIRVFEKLKDDLTCSIPDDIFRSVKVVQVDSFFG
ncbi:TPA: hypothetical protein NPM75_003129 [Klebsiella pneumoniae]|nr:MULTISPECIES: hypothetical protein [Klebsiella]EKW3298589.1 hypothetical protein [Klebsiella oxytoca]HDS5143735.1 hypothetical protein [Klebsiella pneumoniae subsp. pneumoniae]EKU3963648.1 hypothetical protein [Klebsiella pneumoniae]EKV4371877.1 hypothetical protein [Klebsiella pneumoniae]EKW2072604.1 hypothetical protein [Klebsiella pneumoniae]